MTQRIGYIDALRGFTMLLVVFSHIETFCYDIPFNESILSSLFITFRMPMFFFISGYIAYKKELWNFGTYKKKTYKESTYTNHTNFSILPSIFCRMP